MTLEVTKPQSEAHAADAKSFTDLGILTLLIASVLEAKPFGAHAEDCIQLQAGEGD